MLTEIDGSMLAEAFPANHRLQALSAGDAIARVLDSRQWTERLTFQADGQSVLIPARLHFASDPLPMVESGSCPIAWCNFAREATAISSVAGVGHEPGTAESMTMGLSLNGAMVSRVM